MAHRADGRASRTSPARRCPPGITWGWETFPEFLDFLDAQPLAIDVGTQVPHGAVRGYVMGERGARNEPATADDIAAMARIVREGIEAGALGVSTSRTIAHRAIDGEPVPGTFAAEDELFALGRALADAGAGVFELAPAGVMGEDLAAPEREVDWMRRLAQETGRPVTFAVSQHDIGSRPVATRCSTSRSRRYDEGVPMRPQVAGRPLGLLLGLQTFHPLRDRPTLRARSRRCRSTSGSRAMRDPEVRAAILSERGVAGRPHGVHRPRSRPHVPARRAARLRAGARGRASPRVAEREGRDPWDLSTTCCSRTTAAQLLLRPLLGYSNFTHDPIREMLLHPASALGLGDGGAHVGAICDASIETYMLTHWVRDRTRGERLPLELVVRKMTSDTASLYGLDDRGVIAPGKKADVNVIDFDGLDAAPARDGLRPPRRRAAAAAGRRAATCATIVSGEVVMRDGRETGARPGRLVRGGR